MIDQAVNEGNTATFTCQATGDPDATISWQFNDISVKRKTNVNKYTISQSSSLNNTVTNTLTIMNVESSDVGTYTCNATNQPINGVSYDSSSGVLTVNGESLLYTIIFHC